LWQVSRFPFNTAACVRCHGPSNRLQKSERLVIGVTGAAALA
jgi:hypothetical protein